MATTRVVALLGAMILLLTACVDSTDVTTTSPAPDTTASGPTTTSAGPSTTVEPTPGSTLLATPRGECFFLKRYLAVEEGQGEVVAEALADENIESLPASPGDIIPDSPVVEQLEAILDLRDLGDENPLAATQLLIDSGLDVNVGPIYATAQAAHWNFKPGTDPIELTGTSIPDPGPSTDGLYMAVVDSGIVDDPGIQDDLPPWMQGPNVIFDPALDTEVLGDSGLASHGTFVASLIRQLAPARGVALARARPVPADQIYENSHPLPGDVAFISTELHVAEAILRLTENPDLNVENVVGLNLSLGAYTCAPDDDPTLVTTRAALAQWFEVFGFSVVFSAAGNEEPAGVFWPAGYSYYPFDPSLVDRFRGVAAINGNGRQVIWTTTAAAAERAPGPAPQRVWVNNVAPGCGLVGLRGGSATDVVAWSGSSFASAVSAGSYLAVAAQGDPGIPGDIDYTAPGLISVPQGACDF